MTLVERLIPDSGFAGDTGEADAAVARALTAHADGGVSRGEVLLALQDARLLVPVVAILGEVDYDEQGLAHDKSSDMAAVLMRGADGRLALLAFTSTESMQRWDPEARPVPVRTELAAQSVVQEDAAALVVDIAGPVTFVVEGDDVRRLAARQRVVRVGDGIGWVAPE